MSAPGTAAAALFAGGTAGAGVRHLPEVNKSAGEWRMSCTCGTQGPARTARRMAAADFDEHLAAVSDVPPAERCRMPKEHKLRPWERCELCAGQLGLFEAGEVDL